MKRFVVTVAVTGLLAGGAAAVPAAAAPATEAADRAATQNGGAATVAVQTHVGAPGQAGAGFTPKPITWSACEGALGGAGVQCGMLTVPLDYSRPKGTKIKIAVSRVKSTVPAAKYQGVMLVNPGGPGGSGLGFATLGSAVPNNAGAAYDWIGFDPRGVGSSEPSLTCDGDYSAAPRPPYVPTTRKIEKTWLAKSAAYAKACDRAGGALLDHLKTVDTINDMESIRKALGKSKINFYGFSYGTYLGQVYSTLHPNRVRRMVMDGVVDPGEVWYDANLNQNVAFDKGIKVFFGWVAQYDSVYHLGRTAASVERKYYRTLNQLTKAPNGQLGAAEWNDLFVNSAYSVGAWQIVAQAFTEYVNDGDASLATAIGVPGTGPGADNGYAMYLATECTDARWPKDWKTWQADNWKLHAKVPFLTWNNAWFNAPCRTWGAKSGTPVKVNGVKAPKMLLINETLDAATPYSGALEVRSRFPKSVLIEGVGGTQHSGSLSGVACTDDLIAAYLTDGSLPKRVAGRTSDVKCDPVPRPVPSADTTASTLRSATVTDPLSRAALQEQIGPR